MNSNNTTTHCCWNFQINPSPNIEKIFDSNDNDILLVHKYNADNNTFPKKLLHFYSNRIQLGNNLFMVHKLSSDGKIVITLTYNDENGERELQSGIIYMNKKIHIVNKFNIITNKDEGAYDYAECIWF